MQFLNDPTLALICAVLAVVATVLPKVGRLETFIVCASAVCCAAVSVLSFLVIAYYHYGIFGVATIVIIAAISTLAVKFLNSVSRDLSGIGT